MVFSDEINRVLNDIAENRFFCRYIAFADRTRSRPFSTPDRGRSQESKIYPEEGMYEELVLHIMTLKYATQYRRRSGHVVYYYRYQRWSS